MANDEYREPLETARAHGLVARNETRQERAILRAEWRAQVDDEIGGWCITDASLPGTPATDNPSIASFVHAETARHIAAIHNIWLMHSGYLAIPASVESTVRTQVAEEIAAAIEARSNDGTWNVGGQVVFTTAARIAREIGSKEAQ